MDKDGRDLPHRKTKHARGHPSSIRKSKIKNANNFIIFRSEGTFEKSLHFLRSSLAETFLLHYF